MAAFVILLAAPIYRGWGQEGGAFRDPGSLQFAIPRQPLATALESYARASGVEVLYEAEIVAGLVSNPIDGTFTPEMALQIMLENTELRVRYARHDAITLALPELEESLPPAEVLAGADFALDTLRVKGGSQSFDVNRLREFNGAVQLDIEKALRRNAKTRSGNYQIGVRVWVDPSRKISRVLLTKSSGDPERDASIPNALVGVALSRAPPANTPLPIQIVITVRSL